MKLKIFQLNESDCYSATTLMEAVSAALSDTGCDEFDYLLGPRQLTEKELENRFLNEDDGTIVSYAEKLATLNQSDERSASFFSTTEF